MKIAWKIYFWILCVLVLLTLVSIGQWTLVDYGWLIALIVIMPSVYGYAFQKHFGQSKLWRALVLVSVVYYVVYTFYLDPSYGGLPSRSVGDYLTTFLIPLPGFIAAIRHNLSGK